MNRPLPSTVARPAHPSIGSRNARWVSLGLALVLALAALASSPLSRPVPAAAATTTVTNLAHLDLLLDDVSPAAVEGHTTYRLAEEPALQVPWTYADRNDDGTYRRVGGGTLRPDGTWTQGAFNSDDIARAAVVYLRHWRQTGNGASRQKAYDLLRATAYLQSTTGANRGRSVLWMQPDGTLNPSAEPVELPDPSDSGPSYWQARTLWAFGEGYAAFEDADPAFAAFLRDRIRLSVRALNRDVLVRYGRYVEADGRKVPSWLIVDGSDATAEAVLGLSAYVGARDDGLAHDALRQLAKGIAAMASEPDGWPYGAVLPWAQSRSLWHAWSSQQSAALARSSQALGKPSLLKPAVTEAVRFDPTLLTSDGADNGWQPSPTDRVQIPYGVDSRVQSLLAVAEVGGTRLGLDLAGMEAAWFFGANRSGEPMYDPATGVTFDGLEVDGRINRNSGAESTIHGLLTMLALDAHPAVRARATATTELVSRDGLRVVEAESALSTTGTVETPTASWTGESAWSGQYLALEKGQTARIVVGDGNARVRLEPVAWQEEDGRARSRWEQDGRRLGTLKHRVGDQGVTAAPGALLPQRLDRTVVPADGPVTVLAQRGTVRLDAVLVRPLVSRLVLAGEARTTLVHSASGSRQRATVVPEGASARLRVYDAKGKQVENRTIRSAREVRLPAYGVAVLTED
ncbi:hypothetical protein [Microlunatus flavus]|uniref:Uncharacterized protein n=1 Tax=Microlunatus flavus TaxID=1036181 RepID=A0A1H9ALY1_9ACTN|nr:hypothetical protein [Microlunatus flavus]SEP77812.1 hypothetical protein SAMN05421756_101659 [Microlunatus flavus]